ncbi:MAG: nitrogen regulation protein NR(I) [Gammaproteobacteria bacterium]|nr:nitrogen regulation protein NR(I) [Gammaproteobacteria bacterium]
MSLSAPVVWIVDDDKSIRWVLKKALCQAEMEVVEFPSASGVVAALDDSRPDVIVTDIRMPGQSGFELLDDLGAVCPQIPVIITTAHANLDAAVAAFQGGAFEYLPKPFDIDEATDLVRRAVLHSSDDQLEEVPEVLPEAPEIIGKAPAMQNVFRAIARLARSSITVLITGESGTGKELVASALHRHSPRAEGPFIALNMAAINKDLLESELFGHEKGAFTGAQAMRKGRFEQAHGGTLFLDEIGDMPADLQTRLLRVLADGVFYRVGGHAPIRVNVRVVAATHQDLTARVASGQFREDLFHRLNVVRIPLPPLRERREDIADLVPHFLAAAAEELQVDGKSVVDQAMQMLVDYPWPGNVRQLQNTCRWLTVMAPSQWIQVGDLPPEVLIRDDVKVEAGDWLDLLRRTVSHRMRVGETEIMDDIVPQFEQVMIDEALKYTGGRRQDAAKLLGWGRNTLTRKIKDLALDSADPEEV